MNALIFFAIFSAFAAGPASHAVETSSGPTSAEEAQFLWREGQVEAQSGKCADAVYKLQRLLDRYPAAAGYLEAHYWLGHCYHRLRDNKKAQPLLKIFIERARGENLRPLKYQAYAHLIDGSLVSRESRRGAEALLYAEQWLKLPPRLEPGTQALALSYQAKALYAAKRVPDGERTLKSAGALISLASPEAKSVFFETQAQYSLAKCSKFLRDETLREAQVFDQASRRGLCLKETLPIFLKSAELDRSDLTEGLSQRLAAAFGAYRDQCAKFRKLAEEAREKLKSECRLKTDESLQLLKSLPQNEAIAALIDRILSQQSPGKKL